MIDLCKIFGVEEGEEFKIEGCILTDGLVYKIQDNILKVVKGKHEGRSLLDVNELKEITDIIKLPKKKEFSDDELVIMRSLPKEYKWMARDKATNIVCAYGSKPKKSEYKTWHSESSYYAILGIFNHLFNSIQWEDEEPIFIDDYVERGGE
jgi:hypothetical protein